MLGKAISLEGSEDGIKQYLSSDWSVLVDRPEVWPKAVSQIFFSIGINFGMMTAYGKSCVTSWSPEFAVFSSPITCALDCDLNTAQAHTAGETSPPC